MRQRWCCWLLQLLPGVIPHNTVIQYNIGVIQYNVIQHNVSVMQFNTVVILHNVILHNISVIQYNTVTSPSFKRKLRYSYFTVGCMILVFILYVPYTVKIIMFYTVVFILVKYPYWQLLMFLVRCALFRFLQPVFGVWLHCAVA